jgi:DNA-binding MarR family transcriptional regulator
VKLEIHNMAGHLIRRLHQHSVSTFNETLAGSDYAITPVQFAAMNALRVNPAIDQRTLARLIGYDPATIGGVVDRLEAKGYVARQINPQDRRARLLELTEFGARALAEVIPMVRAAQTAILTGLDEAQRDQFLALARQVVDASSDVEPSRADGAVDGAEAEGTSGRAS